MLSYPAKCYCFVVLLCQGRKKMMQVEERHYYEREE